MRWEIKKSAPFGALIRAEGKVQDIPSGFIQACLDTFSLVLIRGVKSPTREEFLTFCKSYPKAKLLEWETGPVMEMKVDANAKNYLFSNERVPFHWDGAFFKVPSILAFHCITPPSTGAGGETLFCNTSLIWDSATPSQKRTWRKLRLRYVTEKVAHYGGTVEVPLVDTHPKNGRTILRFAEAVESALNPVTLELFGLANEKQHRAALKELVGLVYNPRFLQEVRWQEGDILLADNHTLIHGRRAFKKSSPRHLRRIQIL